MDSPTVVFQVRYIPYHGSSLQLEPYDTISQEYLPYIWKKWRFHQGFLLCMVSWLIMCLLKYMIILKFYISHNIYTDVRYSFQFLLHLNGLDKVVFTLIWIQLLLLLVVLKQLLTVLVPLLLLSLLLDLRSGSVSAHAYSDSFAYIVAGGSWSVRYAAGSKTF